MSEPAIALALLRIGFYQAATEENEADLSKKAFRLLKLVQPVIAENQGFIYIQAPGELRAAFLETSRAITCLSSLQLSSQTEEWCEVGLNLTLKLSFELHLTRGQLTSSKNNTELQNEAGIGDPPITAEDNDWLLNKLAGHFKSGKAGEPVDRHWYIFFNGMYRPGLDWLQKQLLLDQNYSKNLIFCVMALLHHRLGENAEALRLAESASTGFDNGRDMSGQFLVFLILAKVTRLEIPGNSSGFEAKAELLRQKIQASRRLFALYSSLGKAARLQGQPHAAYSLFEGCLELSLETGDKVGEIMALCNLADTSQALRQYEKMSELFDRAFDRLREFEKGLNRPALLVVLAYLIAEPGDTSLASELLAESKRQNIPLGKDNPLFSDLLATAEIALGLAPADKIQGLYRRRLALAWRSLNPYSFAFALLGQAGVWLEQGQLNQAKPALRRSFNIGLQSRNWAVVVQTLEILAIFWSRESQDKRAARLFSSAANLRMQFGLAQTHLQKVKYDQNLELLKTRLGPRIFKQTWVKGSNLNLQEALKIGLGANSRLKPFKRPSQPRPELAPAPTGEIVSLSQREKEVLYLVATGLTNPQIALQMTLSTYTVSSYLRSIYNKLGVTTRTAASSYAFKNLYKLP